MSRYEPRKRDRPRGRKRGCRPAKISKKFRQETEEERASRLELVERLSEDHEQQVRRVKRMQWLLGRKHKRYIPYREAQDYLVIEGDEDLLAELDEENARRRAPSWQPETYEDDLDDQEWDEEDEEISCVDDRGIFLGIPVPKDFIK